MGTTTNYGYNVPVGSDNVNLLPQMAANFPMIDSDLKAVSNAAIGSATELTTGSVHALTRADTSRNVFVFVATSNYEAGETFEVDGVQVTAKTPDGQNLSSGAYVINSGVLCVLNGTLLTVIVSPAKALDADKLDGHDSSYFAIASDLSTLDETVGAISGKVGSGALDVGANCVNAINIINEYVSATTWGTPVNITTTEYTATRDGYLILNSSTLLTGKMGVKIYDSTHTAKTVLETVITDRYQYASVFVRKGMGVSLTDDTTSGVVAQFNTLLP